MRMLLAISIAILSPTAVNAATHTRSFTLTASSFMNFSSDPAPFSALTIDFTLSYDDALSGFQGAPDSFTAMTDGNINAGAFSAAPIFGYFPANGLTPYPRLGVGGAINGGNVSLPGTNDFYFTFDESAIGPTPAMLSFSVPGLSGFMAINAQVSEKIAAVPEPASWSLLITGMGLTGAALRRRPWRTAPSLSPTV